MLLELAIGDAYGAGFEYAPKETVDRFNDLSGYHRHHKYNIGNGRYTDDTQMSIGIAELLIDGCEWTPLNIANKFVEVFKRDTREGYAGGFYKFLQEVKNGKEFLERINPDSDKSGGAMRSCPIGFLSDIKQVIEYARLQASLTHDTQIGRDSAIASSLMSHYFIHDLGNKKELGKFISKYVSGEWNIPWKEEVKSPGYMHVRAAITAIQEMSSMSGLLKRCIDFTGDVDTVAAIALGSASCSREIIQDIPKHLLGGLENGSYGRDCLIEMDKKIKKKFGVKK